MSIADEALVLTVLPHGEHGAVVHFLTFSHGLRAGYVAGARSRTRRATLQPGNKVALGLRGRSEGQLATATVETVTSRALIAFDASNAAILAWLTQLVAQTLSIAVPHQRLADALDALLAGLDHGMDRLDARAAVAKFELLLLAEEGFGLDLGQCALGGPGDELAFISPRSGRAISRRMAMGQPWAAKLLPLPPFLVSDAPPTPADIEQALALTGHFLARHWFDNRPRLAAARRIFFRTSPEQLAVSLPASKKER